MFVIINVMPAVAMWLLCNLDLSINDEIPEESDGKTIIVIISLISVSIMYF